MGRNGNRAVIFFNSGSGWEENREAPEITRQKLQSRGIDCALERLKPGADIEQSVTQAVAQGSRLVVAGGGDGTLRAVAQSLAGTGVAMGILPVGTLNHFARDLEIPLDADEAAHVVASGLPVEVDVAAANGSVFINNAVIGLYPAYRAEREAHERRGWRGKLAGIAGWLSILHRYPFVEVDISAGGRHIRRRTPLVMIGNNEHAMHGFKPWQRESMTEGALWVYVARDATRLGLWRVLWRVITGRFEAEQHFDVLRGSDVWVRTRRRRIRISLDGEIKRLQSPIHFQSWPSALRVVVPQGSRRALEQSQCA